MNYSKIKITAVALLLNGYACADEPGIKSVEESLTGKISHISNLTINIECNPRQVIKDIKQDLFLWFCKFPQIPVRKYGSDLTTLLYESRYYVGGAAGIGLYLFLLYEVIKANACLSSQYSWSLWKHEVPLDELLGISAQQLSSELLLEIQRRYTSAQAPADFVSSLVAFLKDIDQEIAAVKYYSNLVIWLKKLRVSILFPIRHKLFATAPERLRRLYYIRNVFLSWAAQYKMDQNKRCII